MTDLFDPQNLDNEIEDKDYLEVLLGPGGKYDKSKYASEAEALKAMAKGKYLADLTVEQRNAENANMRKEYLELLEQHNAGPKVQERIDEILKHLNANREQPPVIPNEINKPSIDPKQIEEMVQATVLKTEQERTQRENYNLVRTKLREEYGNNFASILEEKAEELGLTKETVNSLAHNHPKLLFKALGVGEQQREGSFQAPAKSSQRGDSFSPGTQKRDGAYYEKMRKENPQLYDSPKIQLQRMQDAAELKDEFFKNWK